MTDENYLAKKAMYEDLAKRGIVKGTYEEYLSQFLSEEERAEIKTAQEKEEKKTDYLNWKSKMAPEELRQYNFVFSE